MFAVCGDIIAADSPLMCGQGVFSKSHGDFSLIFKNLVEYAKDKEFLIGNFEAVLVPKIVRMTPAQSAMKSPAVVIDQLQKCRFKYLSMANNHTMEYGPDAYNWMRTRLEDAGIMTFGHRQSPVLMTELANGTKIGLLAFSSVPAFYGHAPLYYFVQSNDENSAQELVKRIQEYKEKCDCLLVFPHWGNEFMTIPAEWQINLAERMALAGADAIIGAHPHVIQTACLLEPPKIPVFFSIGNLLSDYIQPEIKENMLISVDIEAGKVSCGVDYYSCDDDYRIVPLIDHASFGYGTPDRVPPNEYKRLANGCRVRVRNQLIRHLARTCSVWLFNGGFIWWLVKRAFFLLRNFRNIRHDPNKVYNGPIH